MMTAECKTAVPQYAAWIPPGMDMRGELGFFAVGMLASAVYSCGFFFRLYQAQDALYQWDIAAGRRTLIADAVMPPFYEIFGHAWLGYFILLLCMLGWGIYHAAYYRQGTKSIYLMRRLPDPLSYYRYTWASTLCAVLLCLLLAAGCLLLFFGIYHLAVPEQCLADGQWHLLWDHLLKRF